MPWSEIASRRGRPCLADGLQTRLVDRNETLDLAALAGGSCLGGVTSRWVGSSVLVATNDQLRSAAALIELDGVARRMTIAPPDLNPDHLRTIVEDAEIDTAVSDHPERFADLGLSFVAPIRLPIQAAVVPEGRFDTEWVMLTSGTLGRPKMVAHTLDALTGAITGKPPGEGPTVWSTFYDIRRYGGLQMLLRALLGKTDFVLTDPAEPLGDLLHRLGREGVTAISGTPSHWRRVLMSHERAALRPSYIRLSGEIAQQLVLDGLRAAYPGAVIEHAYASTEAGVGFVVNDGREGFPVSFVEKPRGAVEMKVAGGSLRIRSKRAASRYLGAAAPPLTDLEGFVDTGDLVEQRGDRYVFVGRRGGIINVGGLKVNPEEVEAAINSHDLVRMSLVQARKSPLTGAIVVADVVLRDPGVGSDALKQDILETCRARLDRHKVPVVVRFVPELALSAGGKLARAQGRS